MCDGSLCSLTLLKCHQSPREAAEQSGEEETLWDRLTDGHQGLTPKNFVNNPGMKKKQMVATVRSGEMQMQTH